MAEATPQTGGPPKEETPSTPASDTKAPPKRERKKREYKKPWTPAREQQLAAARAVHMAEAAARKQKKMQEKRDRKKKKKEAQEKDDDEPMEEDLPEPEPEKKTARLVKEDGAAAERYLETLKQYNPDVNVEKSAKKRKHDGSGPSGKNEEVDHKSAILAGLALAAIGGIAYVGGKNSLPTALNAKFTSPGSAILPDPTTGQAAIPTSSIVGPPGALPQRTGFGGYGAPALGLF